MTAGAKATRDLKPWIWAAMLLPVFLGAGVFSFFGWTASGQKMWVELRYRNLKYPERLPFSRTAQADRNPPRLRVTIHIRADGRFHLGMAGCKYLHPESHSPGLPASHAHTSCICSQLPGTKEVPSVIRENALPWLDPESRCLLTLYILADRRCQAADIVRLVKMARKERIWRFRIGALRMPPPSRGSDRHWAAVIQLNYPREPNDLSVLRLAPGATAQDLVDALDAAAADQRAVILDTNGD